MIFTLLIYVLVLALLVFAYHYERNGNPLPEGDFLERLFWALSFSIGFLAINAEQHNFYLSAVLFVTQFIAMLIPHAFAQNMGHRIQAWEQMPRIKLWGSITIPKWWPAYWMKLFIDDLSYFEQDFLGMGTVGLLRGLLVFGIPFVLGLYFPIFFGINYLIFVICVAISTIWQPIAYTLGPLVPFSIWTNQANTPAWGEFLIPFGWWFCLLVISICSH